MAASLSMMNTSVPLQDESSSLLTLLDPASLYPLMIQAQEVEVEDGDDDFEGQIFAFVQQLLVAVA